MPTFRTLDETPHVTTVGITLGAGDPPLPDTAMPAGPPPTRRYDAPLCAHLVPCKRIRVRKEGPNQGRHFYACARAMSDPDKCGHFQWESEFDPAAYSPPEVAPPEAPEVPVTREDLLRRLDMTPEEVEAARFAEQRSELWFRARTGRLTASNFGAAAELNKHCSRRDLVRQMLWPHCFTGNEMTQWGTVMEDVCCQHFVQYYRDQRGLAGFRVEESGLHICADLPWCGTSPDGIVWQGDRRVALLEIKTPFTCKDKPPGPEAFYPYADVPGGDRPGCPNPRRLPVPPYYYCQVQGNMRNLGLELCFFVVWTPQGMQVSRFRYDPEWATGVLFPRLREFYFEHYLPAAELHANGRLKPGCTAEEPPEEEAGW